MLRFLDQEQDDNSDQVAGLNLQGLYQKADKAMGGWLPGGGTGNPLSKPVRQAIQAATKPPVAELKKPPVPYQRIPGATNDSPALKPDGSLTKEGKEVLRQLGSTATTTNKLSETNPLAQIGATMGFGGAAHANPFKNQIYLPDGLNDLTTLAHEAGHLNHNQRKGNRPPLEGVLGLALSTPAAAIKNATGGELSPFAQLLAPLRILGGGVTAYSDAHEEDHAEKFAHRAMKGMTGKGTGAIGDAGSFNTPSMYSENLFVGGRESAKEGAADLLIPPQIKALAIGLKQLEPKEKAGPPAPRASKFELRSNAIMAGADLMYEQNKNPKSPLIPRLKKIKEDADRALANFKP